MLKHVLVPLDGSPLSERALDAARRVLAADGKMTLMTAVQMAGQFSVSPSSDVIENTSGNSTSQEESYLNHLATNMQLHGLQTAIEIVTGNPVDAIIERATTLGVEAIVISSHGHSGLRDLFFGGTAQTLLNKAPCLLIVVPNREQIRVEDEEPVIVPDAPIVPDTGLTPAI
jgi:nucleotide-binding universal stress UspA family protein